MSECIGEGCDHQSHAVEGPKPTERTKTPDWWVFQMGETFPMRGFNFKFVGYTKNDEIVFKPVGITSKEAKRRGFLRREYKI